MYASPVSDPLVDRLSLTRLPVASISTATTTNQTSKDLIATNGPNPGSLAALAVVPAGITAAHTVDITIEGSNDGFTTPTTVGTFAQFTNANANTEQKINISRAFKAYRVKTVSLGAFGGPTILPVVVLVGTNLRSAPYTAV